MGRVRTTLEDCEYFLVVSVFCFVLSLCLSAWMIGIDIIDEMEEFTEKIRSDLEEFEILAADATKTMLDFTIRSIERTDFEPSYRKTFNAILRLYGYERKRRYCLRKSWNP